MAKPKSFQEQRDLAFLLGDTGRKLNDAYDCHIKPLGLTRSQWRVVAHVSRTSGITQTQLATNIEVSRMAITGLLDRMQVKGLVERRDHPSDRRIKTVHLTPKSSALVSRINQAAETALSEIFNGVSSKDRKLFGSLLLKIKANAEGSIAHFGTKP